LDVVEEAKRVKRKFIKLENEEKEKLKRIEEWKETVEKERRKIEIEKRKQEILGKLMDDKRIYISLPKLGEQLNNLIGSDKIVVKTIQESKNKNILYGLVIPREDMNKILSVGTDFKTNKTQSKL